MFKKTSFGKKIFNILFFIFIVWLIYKLFQFVISRQKEGYFAPLGKESFAALGCDPKKDPNCK
jgi:hypothetical protein|uniref:Uncharacterized protein n=1 Tax=viral metagenome TaxID=1070528 RepID=A0A6C0H9X3_9ZZZZ